MKRKTPKFFFAFFVHELIASERTIDRDEDEGEDRSREDHMIVSDCNLREALTVLIFDSRT